jgi:peptidoglycan/xylan/chitin deacetylase (PgdA/CDA1 family)
MSFRMNQHKLRVLPLTLCVFLLAQFLATGATAEQVGFNRATTTQKVVALTFDADMAPSMLRDLRSGKVGSWYNKNVIAVLRRERVPATLFLAGLWIETYSAATRDLSGDPLFELGNHSYSHGGFHSPCYGLSAIKKSDKTGEVRKTDALLKSNASTFRKYFRFPGLCFDADDVKTVQAQGYTVIGGDVDGGDAFERSTAQIVRSVVDHVQPGSIVILHMHGGPNAPQTANALLEIIEKLRARGYTFAKVSDLLELRGK